MRASLVCAKGKILPADDGAGNSNTQCPCQNERIAMKIKLTTTLNLLRRHSACESGYRKLIRALGDQYPKDEPINLLTILASNGVQDMLWAMRATVEDSTAARCMIAADCAESVFHIFEEQFPNDNRPRLAIQAARDFAAGKISARAAEAAGDAARAAGAAGAAGAAWAAGDAARAARETGDADAAGAAWAAAWAAGAAEAAVAAEAAGATWAARAAWAAGDAAEAAGESEIEKQVLIIKRWLE